MPHALNGLLPIIRVKERNCAPCSPTPNLLPRLTGASAKARCCTWSPRMLLFEAMASNSTLNERESPARAGFQGNTSAAAAKAESFSLLYLNPPYDSEIGSLVNRRMEAVFLEHTDVVGDGRDYGSRDPVRVIA